MESICPRFDQLVEMIEDLQLRGQGSKQIELFQQRTQKLQRAAQIVLSSASSIIGDSRSAASVMSNTQGRTGSEMGTPLNPTQRNRIQDWIPPPIIEEDLHSMSTKSEGVETLFGKLELKESQIRLVTDLETTLFVPQTAPTPMPYSEVEDNFELEISQRLFVQGQKHYQSKEYILARQCLTKAMAKVERLSPKSQGKLSVGGVKLLLAQVYLEMNKNGEHCIATNDKGEYICSQKCQEDLEISEQLLLDLLRDSKKDFEELRVEASYTLCQVYSHQKRQQEAYDLCRRNVIALKAQKSTLWSWMSTFLSHDTAQSHQYVLGVALLSQICKIRGDVTEAAMYNDLLKEHCLQQKGNSQREVAQDLGLAQKKGIHNQQRVRLWDSATGAVQCTLEGHSDWVSSVAFSPDGRLVASASADRTVRLWDSATGAVQCTLEGHSDWVLSVAFSPDGRLVASASEDRTVRLWDPATGAVQRTLEGHSNAALSVAFSPDGRLVASASEDHTVRLWDPATGAVQCTLEGHSDRVLSVAFSPDGRLVASASWDRTVRLWDPATGAVQRTLEGHSNAALSVAFSPDGRLVASASWDRTVRLWDPATGAVQRTLEGHSNAALSVAFSPDGRLVASASEDRTVRLWDPATGAVQRTLEGHSNAALSVAFSPDGRLVASASEDRTVRLWDSVIGRV